MAQFIGKVQGGRGEASRLGTKGSGMTTTAASWEGAVTTTLWYNEERKINMARIELRTWHGRGINVLIYEGPVSGEDYRENIVKDLKSRENL